MKDARWGLFSKKSKKLLILFGKYTKRQQENNFLKSFVTNSSLP